MGTFGRIEIEVPRARLNNAPKFPTVTMVDSRTLTRADGTTSLRLDTKEFGSIAFRIDLKAIEILRRELATAEAFLRQPTGKA